MKKILKFSFLFFVSFLITPLIFGKVEAAFLKFDPSSISASAGESFSVSVVVDAGSDEINSTDIYVIYDPSLLEAQSVSAGSFFPTVTHNITSGRIYIAGMVDDPASSKTGSGTVATVTFKALSGGSTTISFDCSSSKIIKNDINATNIIDCNQNQTAQITIGGGGGGGDNNPTPPPISSLPRSGIFDSVVKWTIPAIVLLFIGGAVRLIL